MIYELDESLIPIKHYYLGLSDENRRASRDSCLNTGKGIVLIRAAICNSAEPSWKEMRHGPNYSEQSEVTAGLQIKNAIFG